MCGIYGILDTGGRRSDPAVVRRMGDKMIHRGPDDEGYYADRGLIMGMRRLSIIDVAGGQQPITNESGDVVTVCNGEIYNFQELRDSLLRKGHTFRSGSDCEVIVHLYEEFGDEFVNQLSGMFGLALWDARKQKLLLARDRLGIKPLYTAFVDGFLIFASELKSLLECSAIERQVDPEALREYLALGYVPAPLSIIKGVNKLPPAYLLSAESGQVTQRSYWQMSFEQTESNSIDDWAHEIRDAIKASVEAQMISDVPLGAFLSGGIDSSAVVAFMAKNSDRPVRTYSIGFDTGTGGGNYNELPYARKIAELFKTDHHEIVVRPDVAVLLPELIWHLDEPIADAAFITTYLVSKFARQDVTVILSGVGGDELFGGYRRYWSEHLVSRYRRIPSLIRRALLQPIGRVLPSDRHSKLMDWSRLLKGFLAAAELPSDERYESYVRAFSSGHIEALLGESVPPRSRAMLNAFARASTKDPVRRLMDVDLATQLPDDLLALTDRMSMAASLECRVPLLDDRLLELSCRMPSTMKVSGTNLKYALKRALEGVLPGDIIHRKKRGFGAPIGGWYKNELAGYVDNVLSRERIEYRGLFEWAEIEKLKALHRSSREDYTDNLSSLVNFEIWSQIFLDGDAPSDVVDRLHEARAA